MSLTKTNLKLARESISKKDYANTKKYSLKILDFEPENYHAYIQLSTYTCILLLILHEHLSRLVFLGVAHLELDEYNECEQVISSFVDES